MTKVSLLEVARGCCRCGECPHARDRNSDGWQKCFTNVPPGASRGSADHNVKNVLAASAMPWMGRVGGGCMTTPTSTSTSHNMLKYLYAKVLLI